MLYSIELWSHFGAGIAATFLFFSFSFANVLSLLDTCLLTGEVTEIEDASPTDFTVLVHFDAVNERGLIREDSFDTDSTGNFAYGEGLRKGILALRLDDDSSEFLKSLLVTFFDPVGNGDRITRLEIRIFRDFFVLKSLLCNFDQIHFFRLLMQLYANFETIRKRLLVFSDCKYTDYF